MRALDSVLQRRRHYRRYSRRHSLRIRVPLMLSAFQMLTVRQTVLSAYVVMAFLDPLAISAKYQELLCAYQMRRRGSVIKQSILHQYVRLAKVSLDVMAVYVYPIRLAPIKQSCLVTRTRTITAQ